MNNAKWSPLVGSLSKGLSRQLKMLVAVVIYVQAMLLFSLETSQYAQVVWILFCGLGSWGLFFVTLKIGVFSPVWMEPYVSSAFGGLGMALQTSFSHQGGSATLCNCSSGSSFLSVGTFVMWVFCLLGCLLCPNGHAPRGFWLLSRGLICLPAMTVGMVLAQACLERWEVAPALSHLVMVIGMFLGSVAGVGAAAALSYGYQNLCAAFHLSSNRLRPLDSNVGPVRANSGTSLKSI